MRHNRSTSFLKSFMNFLLHLENALLVGLFLLMAGTAVLQIVLRNIFNSGIVWGDIMIRIIVLWIGLIGAMIASRAGEHISIDLISRYVPSRFGNLLEGICAFITGIICSVVFYYGIQFVVREFEEGGTAFAGIPVWLCASVIPFGFAVIALRFFIISFSNLTTFFHPSS